MIKYALILASIIGIGYFSYTAGVDSQKAKQAGLIAAGIEAGQKKAKIIIEYREKIKVIYRDKKQKIKRVIDKTGCSDIRLIDLGFSL